MLLKKEDINKHFCDEEGEELVVTEIVGKKVKVEYVRDGWTCKLLMDDIYTLTTKQGE